MSSTAPPESPFMYSFCTKGEKSTLTVSIPLPLQHSVSEFAGRLINAHNLPCFIHEDLKREVGNFVQEETEKIQDGEASEAIKRVRTGEMDVNNLVDRWTQAFTQEVRKYSKPEPLTNELVFSEVYHALIHSPALETLLNLEHTYAMDVSAVTERRDEDLRNLEDRQRSEMELAVQSLGITYTDEQINQLAQRHFENMELGSSKWASELSNIQDTQKREYREWVMRVHEDTQATEATPAYVQQVRALSSTLPPREGVKDEVDSTHQARREESFTVHLGAQLKTTHNLRLISASPLDFCRHKPHKIGGVMVPQPQRLLTAMSLYSNDLCGLTLLVDNTLSSYTGIKREFARVCEQSTDFHFSDLEQQFEVIEQHINSACEWRAQQQKLRDDVDRVSLKSSGSSSSEKEDRSVKMQPGDFYITRHSNLSEVHVVFHLVTDDSVRSAVSELSSRHPVILGYRNILKACFRYDIHTVTLPLLLVHEMSEEMTIPWCMKRAELVFKCVKGFMMELATWSGQESRTIQFLVPPSLSDETFASFSSMLSSIFRMSNPVMAKST